MAASSSTPPLRVALIGHSFMGQVHSHGWRNAAAAFDLPLAPEMKLLVGRDEGRVSKAARRLGWAECATDYRAVLERDDIDVIDICTPGDTHAEIAIAALAAGKHVLIEKPMANTLAEAERMALAAAEASSRGVRSMVGFTNRRVPAVALGRRLIEQGRIGTIRHVRGFYFQDWIADADVPLSWRLDKSRAGSGALGDIGAHAVDLAMYWTGDRISEVVSSLKTFVTERPLAGDHDGLTFSAGSEGTGPVTVDDSASFLAHFEGGAEGFFQATRFAAGRKNALRVEVNGTKGSLAFDLEDYNILEFSDFTEDSDIAGFHRIHCTEATHPYAGNWWPAGHSLGFDAGFSNEIADFVRAVSRDEDPRPSFAEGLAVQRVLDAVEKSAESRSWESITY